MSPACVYCGRDAGPFDEHDDCRERSIAGGCSECGRWSGHEPDCPHGPDLDPLTGAPAPDPDSLYDRER